MMTASLAAAPARTGPHYEVLLRASIATRFRVTERWIIAGSFTTEAAAQREFAALSKEFQADRVNLRLVLSEADAAGEFYRERVLARREPAPLAGHRRFLRQPAEPRAAFRARTAPERPRRSAEPAAAPGPAARSWPLLVAASLALLALTLLLG